MTVRWRTAKLPPHGGYLGHGLCIRATGQPSGEGPDLLVAFVEGFAWAKGGDHAVILFDPGRVPAERRKEVRVAIEACLRDGRLSGEIAPGLHVIANA